MIDARILVSGRTELRAGWKPGSESVTPLPPSLQSAVRGRFAQLPPDARELLRIAATIGTAFRLPVLTHAADQDDGDLVRNIDELWRQRIIREQGTDGYEFTHGKLCEVAYADLSNARKASLHGRVAEAYRAVHASSGEPAGLEVAWHLELSGRRLDAGRAYIDAAEAARNVYAHESAAAHYRRALDLVPAGQRLDVLLSLGQTLQLSGDWQEAERTYHLALEGALTARDAGLTARCRIAIGDLLRLSGRFADALEWLEAARAGLDRAPASTRDPAALANVTGLICEVLIWLARYADAEEYARRQFGLAEEAADTAELAAANANLGTVCSRRTQYDEALRFYERNLELEEQMNDPSRLHLAMGRIGNLYRLRGEFLPAQEYLQRQLDLAQKVGNIHAEAMAANNLSNLMEEQGEFEAASAWVQKALTTYRRLGDRQREAASLGNLGVLLHDRGDLPQAWQYIARSIEMQLQVGDTRNAAVALGSLGPVYSDVGSFGAAHDCLIAGILISLEIDNPQNVTIVAGAMGEAYLLQGRTAEAARFLERASSLARLLNMSYWLCVELHLLAHAQAQEGRVEEAIILNDEALALTARSPHREVRFWTELLRLRLSAITDKAQVTASVRELQKLSASHKTDEDIAAIEYEIWMIDRSRDKARQNAARRYSRAYRRTPKFQYAQRLEELTGDRPETPPPLPDPPSVVREWHSDPIQILARLDELYQRLSRSDLAVT